MLILVYGLPGTGKSFLSRKLKDILSAHYLNTDIVREKLGKKGQYDLESKQAVYDDLFRKTREFLKKDEDLIIDGTFHLTKRREKLREIAEEFGRKIYFIQMKADETTIKERLKKSRKYSEAGFEIYQKLKYEFEEVTENHLILWSDRDSGEEMLNKTRNFLYE